MHNGEWFSSLLRRHTSCDEWHRMPSSFTAQLPNVGVINTAYRLVLRSCPITTTHFRCPMTIRSVHLKSNGAHSLCPHFSRYPLPSHLHRIFSRSDGQSCSFNQLIHFPRNPHPLTVSCTRRTMVTSLPVLVAAAPQQPYLTNNMVEKEKERTRVDNCI